MLFSILENLLINYLQSLNSEEELLQSIYDLNTFKLNIKDRHILPELKKELWIEEKDLMRSSFIGLKVAKKLGISLRPFQDKSEISFDILTNNVSNQTEKTAQEIIEILQKKIT